MGGHRANSLSLRKRAGVRGQSGQTVPNRCMNFRSRIAKRLPCQHFQRRARFFQSLHFGGPCCGWKNLRSTLKILSPKPLHAKIWLFRRICGWPRCQLPLPPERAGVRGQSGQTVFVQAHCDVRLVFRDSRNAQADTPLLPTGLFVWHSGRFVQPVVRHRLR